jgi:hypothetical protein
VAEIVLVAISEWHSYRRRGFVEGLSLKCFLKTAARYKEKFDSLSL